MTDGELIQRVAEYFCKHAFWPSYVSLNVEQLESGGIGPLLSNVGSDILRVYGSGEDATVRFPTLATFAAHVPCAATDIPNFARAAGYFAERVTQARRVSDKLEISAREIGDSLQLEGTNLRRLIRLIDEFGSDLNSGGTRGPDLVDWTFRVRYTAEYFMGVSTIEMYLKRVEMIRDIEKREYESRHGSPEQSHIARRKDHSSRYDVFLSYSAQDSGAASELHERIQDRGYAVYYAGKSLSGGDMFSEEIREALIQSRELWVLLTPHSLKSEWVISEWGAGWALEKRIVPILLRCQPEMLPARLGSLHCTDYHDIEKLLQDFDVRSGRKSDGA